MCQALLGPQGGGPRRGASSEDVGCLAEICEDSCGTCTVGEGPDDDPAGCYWDPDLGGTCGAYWSFDTRSDNPSFAWYVGFDDGRVSSSIAAAEYSARCVDDGP